jgi:diguanylate cyclase (GGDEF)-like protein
MLKNNFGLILSIFIGLVFSLFYLLGLTNKFEQSLGYDFSFALRKKTLPNDNIKIIGIDQKSLDYIGTFPWRRDLYSKLLDILGNYPKVIGFDIIMPEYSEYIQDDELLSISIKNSNKVILPVSLEPNKETLELEFVYPLDILQKNAKDIGNIHFFPDKDGIVRKSKIKTQIKNENNYIYIFSYVLAKNFLLSNNQYLNDIPDTIYCNFQGNQDIFETYSFYDVISGKIDPKIFNNSIVIIGGLAEGLQDRISTPIGPMYGVIYHAQMTSNILNNDFIKILPKEVNVIIIILIALLTFFSWKYLETINQSLIVAFSVVSLYALHLILFSNNIYINIFTIIITNIFTFITLIIFSQYRIAKSLKFQVDNLINYYQEKSFNYSTDINDSDKKTNASDINTQRVKILSQISYNLAIERSFLETLLNNINISIIVTDSIGNVIINNPAAEKFFGKDILNSNMEEISSNIPELKEKIKDILLNKNNLPCEFQIEFLEYIYKIKVFNLNDKNIVFLIENITDWHQMANKDGLTGIWNQRYFKDILKKEIERSKRYKNPLSLIMMDVDHFKSFNDTYGHQTGDLVLKSIANVLKESVRNTDIPSRYGGEEFAVILPMTDEKGAEKFAERLRRKIENLKIKDINGNNVRQVTSSFGVCYYNENYSLNEFIEYADKSLYMCKKRGRNCVTKFSEIMSLENAKNF